MNFLRNLIQGGQSSQKAESGQKKGGPPTSKVATTGSPPPPPKEVSTSSHEIRTSPIPPAVATAPPLLSTSTPHPVSQETPGVHEPEKGKGVSKPIQEDLIIQRTDIEDNFTNQDKSASSEGNSNSCTRDTDATSLTEDVSFASCLTDPSTSLSEDGKIVVDSTSQLPAEVDETTARSTYDTPLSSDSEYESAPETDIPQDQPQSHQKVILDTEDKIREEATGQQKEEGKGAEESVSRQCEGSSGVRESVDGEAPTEPKEVTQQVEQTLSDQTTPSEHNTENPEKTHHHIEKQKTDDRDECELAYSSSVTVPENSTNCISASASDHIPFPSSNLFPQTEESKVEPTGSHILASVDSNNQITLKDTVFNECKQEIDSKEPVSYPAESKSCPDKISVPVKGLLNDEISIVPSKGYDLSFLDQVDDSNFNPFVTKTAIRNSPPPSPQPGVKLPLLKPAIKKKGCQATKIAERPDTPGGPESDLKVTVVKQLESPSEENSKVCTLDQHLKVDPINKERQNSDSSEPPTKNSISDDSIAIEKDVLEIAIDDNNPNKSPLETKERKQSKPKRPIRRQVKKTVIETNNNCIDSKTEALSEKQEDQPLPPSKGYNLDFLDDVDNNFNPFETRAAVSNSPPKDSCTLSADELKEFKSKARIVTPKKTQPKKGFDTTVESSKDSNQTIVKAEDVNLKKLPSKENSCLDIRNIPEVVRSANEFEKLPIDIKKDISKESQVPVEVREENLQSIEPSVCVPKSSHSNKEPEDLVAKVPDGHLSEQEEKLHVNASKENKPDFLEGPNFNPFKSRPDLDNKVQSDIGVKEKDKSIDTAVSDLDVSELKIVKENSSGFDINDCPQSDKQAGVTVSLEWKEVAVINKEESQESKDSVSDLIPSKPEVVRKQGQEVQSPLSEDGHSDESLIESSILKVPSVNKIGRLDSSEFAELLGNEASRLAEELMNCSFDSGLHDSNESVVTNNSLTSSMADSENNRSSVHLDENVNPFQSKSALMRTPPTKHRQLGNGGNDSEIDPFKPRRTLKREEVPGMEERVDTPSMDEDSGIIVGSRSDLMLEADVNHSEAGPEVAMGLTPSDLKCASQSESDVDELLELHDDLSDEEFLASEEFFKEASCLENQLRKSLVTPLGSQTKLSGDEGTPTKDDTPPSLPSPQHKASPPPERRSPPREERSAPEGTSSPTPRSNESAEHKNNNNAERSKTSVPSGYMSSAQVEELLKQQELQFEEKLLRVELSAGEKEKQLRHSMKSEQKQMAELQGNVDELTQSRDALLKMVGQYKSMLSSLVAEKEKENATRDEKLRAVELERNQALQDLANVEAAFSDVHRKYERTKQVVDTLRRNEETLRGAVADYECKLQKQEQKMMELQKHAEERIQQANEEYEQLRRSSEQEITKMSALLKKAEMKIISLQEGVDRKARENQELTQLCDDLINKMGSGK